MQITNIKICIQYNYIFILEGYLHYKKITSENVSFETEVKNFLFHRKVMFCSQDIQVSVFLNIPMIYQI